MTELKKALLSCKSGDCANCPLNSKAYNNECKTILFEEVIAEIETARAEAIKEVLEKAKARCGAPHWCVWLDEFDEIAKEMGVEL